MFAFSWDSSNGRIVTKNKLIEFQRKALRSLDMHQNINSGFFFHISLFSQYD